MTGIGRPGTRVTPVVTPGGEPLLLPAGTRCWARETDTGGAESSVVDHSSYENGTEVVAADAGSLQELTITVTNRFAPAAGPLAYTGADQWGMGVIGVACIAIGAWLVTMRRRGDR